MSNCIKLSDLSEFICCPICHGYLIDATTVSECLHTFCRTCIVTHVKNNHNDCPKCNTIIHERRPMDYIMYDRTKQDIVYKLVPQLYIAELNRKMAVPELCEIDDVTRFILKEKFIQVALVHRERFMKSFILPSPSQSSTTTTDTSTSTTDTTDNEHTRTTIYLNCPITVKAHQIRKILAIKYQLQANNRIILLYKGEVVDDNDHISNLAPSLTFCLQYQISRISEICDTMHEDHVTAAISTASTSTSTSDSIDSNSSDNMSVDEQ